MMMYRKNRIGIRILFIAIMFSFASLNVNTVHATKKSGYDAEQELIRQKKESELTKSKEKKSANKETLVVNSADEDSENEAGGARHFIDFDGPGERYKTMFDKGGGDDSKGGVIVQGGGGNIGQGGGATKSAGGKTGKSIDFSNAGALDKEPIKNSVSDIDGKDLVSETMGFAKDDGEFYKEKEGSHAGVKIFELDRNGSLGLNDEHMAATNMKGFMSFFLFAAFGLGGLSFFMATRDVRSKNNYF